MRDGVDDLAYEMSSVFEIPLLRCCEIFMTLERDG